MNTRADTNAKMERKWDYMMVQGSWYQGCTCESCVGFEKGIERIGRSVGLKFPKNKENK